MHIIVIAVVAFVLVYILLNANKPQQQVTVALTDDGPATDLAPGQYRPFVYISKGKLFIAGNGAQVEQVHSPYVQEMIDRLERRQQMHGWKQNTSLATSFTGQDTLPASDQVSINVISAEFIPGKKLIYCMKDSHVGGLFEYDLESNTERRLMHKQQLSLEDLMADSSGRNILASQAQANGIANIVKITDEGDSYTQLTEGDTVDRAPAWIPGDEDNILYQSAGLARGEEGYVIAVGPSAIKMLDVKKNTLTTVLEHPEVDYIHPRVDLQGNLYFIRRPYEVPRYDNKNMLIDFLFFPFRLARAVFHYLNFFSLMYSRKPLTSADGPMVKADIKEILVKGKRIDAEKALRKEKSVHGVPSLVPSSWQLVRRSPEGQDTVVATNVASFDITSDGSILYSNGYAVFQLKPDQNTNIVLREKLIADVIAS